MHTSGYGDCMLAGLVITATAQRLFVPLTLELSSYLLAEDFLYQCLSVLEGELSPDSCCSYLRLAQEICCEQLKRTVFTFMSRNLLENPHLVTYANPRYHPR